MVNFRPKYLGKIQVLVQNSAVCIPARSVSVNVM